MLRSEFMVTKTEIVAENGMVAGGHFLEAEVGVQMLQEGGNAIDAMAAAAFAAWVVEPAMCNIGGLGLMSVYLAATKEMVVIDHLHRVPFEATPDMYELEAGLDDWGRWRRVKDNANMVGYLSIAVPGALAGIWAALERYGSMTLEKVISPAIDLAEKGFVPDGELALTIGSHLGDIRRFPATAAAFTRDGLPLRPGQAHMAPDHLVRKDLALTLKRVADEGPEAFYQGDLAETIVGHVRDNGGILSLEDLNCYSAHVGPPEQMHTFRRHRYTCSDSLYVPLILNVLEQFDLESLGLDHPRFYHLMIEAQRHAFADCIFHLADPESGASPTQGLLSKDYAAEVAGRIDKRRAAEIVEPGDPWPYEVRITGRRRHPCSRSASQRPSSLPGTTVVTTVDKAGNMTTLLTTLGGAFGSKVTIPGTGIVLNNGMVSVDPEPGHANSIRGGRRMVSFAPPTLMLREDQPFLTLSASGGRRTVSAIAHILCNVVNFGMGIQDAIAAPRVHCEVRNAYIDSRLSPTIQDALHAMGHNLVVCEESFHSPHFGRPIGILRDPASGLLYGGAAPLRRAVAVGF